MLVLGVFILVAAIIFSWSFYAARSAQNTISVTGSAREDVTADSAKWSVEVYQLAFEGNLQSAYATVGSQADAIAANFKQQNLASSTVVQDTVVADQDWSYNKTDSGTTRYRVHEQVTVTSSDVQKIAALAKGVSVLINRGYSITPHQPEYYISTLPQLRVTLLGQAIADAKARAESIAKSGGTSVGALASAASGVVQVLPPDSTGVEDYGQYDTSSVDKEVSVTARATFYVR